MSCDDHDTKGPREVTHSDAASGSKSWFSSRPSKDSAQVPFTNTTSKKLRLMKRPFTPAMLPNELQDKHRTLSRASERHQAGGAERLDFQGRPQK